MHKITHMKTYKYTNNANEKYTSALYGLGCSGLAAPLAALASPLSLRNLVGKQSPWKERKKCAQTSTLDTMHTNTHQHKKKYIYSKHTRLGAYLATLVSTPISWLVVSKNPLLFSLFYLIIIIAPRAHREDWNGQESKCDLLSWNIPKWARKSRGVTPPRSRQRSHRRARSGYLASALYLFIYLFIYRLIHATIGNRDRVTAIA